MMRVLLVFSAFFLFPQMVLAQDAPSSTAASAYALAPPPGLDADDIAIVNPELAQIEIGRRQGQAIALLTTAPLLTVPGVALVLMGNELYLAGGLALLAGMVVTTIFGAYLDYDSQSRMHHYRLAHPRASLDVVGGPGDIGLALRLRL